MSETEFKIADRFDAELAERNSKKKEFKKTKYYNLTQKSGPLTLRIAPPMGELAETSVWSQYYAKHWGYEMQREDGTTVRRTFDCVRVKKGDNIIVDCPECLKIEEMTKRKEALAAAGKEDQLLNDWLEKHSLDKHHLVIAKDKTGEWGYFSLRHRGMSVLREKIKIERQEEQKDVLGASTGAWIKFRKIGTGRDTTVDVSFSYENAAITKADIEQLRQLRPLNQQGFKVSVEDIQKLVDSDGDLKVATAIFTAGQSTNPRPSPTAALRPTPPVTMPVAKPVVAKGKDEDQLLAEAFDEEF